MSSTSPSSSPSSPSPPSPPSTTKLTNLQQLIVDTTPTQFTQILQKTIPTLSSKSHKGSSGRISILGGSAKYTGAPYYAAMSALRTGCDLVTVHCAIEATVPLKSYSPELMVEGVYSASEFDSLSMKKNKKEKHEQYTQQQQQELLLNQQKVINDMVNKVTCNFERLHAIIIGPGLGRCPLVMKATSIIIQKAIEHDLNIVLDADGLYLLTYKENWDIFSNLWTSLSKSKIVLTPNVIEYKRLLNTMGEGSEDVLKSKLRGVTIIRKGHEDVIEFIPEVDDMSVKQQEQQQQHEHYKMICTEEGGLKRSGGLGDILAGIVGTFVAWNEILSKQDVLVPDDVDDDDDDDDDTNQQNLLLGCWMASCFTKRSTARSFQKKKRSMTAPDVIEEIGDVVDEIASSTIVK